MVEVPKEMRRMREAERTFSREVSRSQLREFAEHVRWIQRRPLRQARRAAFSKNRDSTVVEKFRPSSPNYLYVLAKEAQDSDHRAYETFIKSLGLEATEDTIAAADERFRVAFRSEGRNVREWWLEPSEGARQWLYRELERSSRAKPRTRQTVSLDLSSAEKHITHEDLHRFEDPDLTAFIDAEAQRAKEAKLHAIVEGLPERQHQILMLKVEGLKYGQIAEEMGTSLSTVKSHARALRENPDLRGLYEAW